MYLLRIPCLDLVLLRNIRVVGLSGGAHVPFCFISVEIRNVEAILRGNLTLFFMWQLPL